MSKNKGMVRQPAVLPLNEGRAFGFKTKEVNTFAREQYQDNFGFWQRMFGVYEYLKINKLQRYRVHNIKGHPLMLQPWNSCVVKPTRSMTISDRELIGAPAAIFEKFCLDEFLNSAYDQLLSWHNGDVELDEEGQAIITRSVDELMANSALAVRLSLTAGRFFDVNNVAMSPSNTANLNDLFERTYATWKGWIKHMYDESQSDTKNFGHLNTKTVDFNHDFDSDGVFNGDILELYDMLVAKAQKPLRRLINRGGIGSRNGRKAFIPMFVVSDSFYTAVTQKWNAIADQQATNRQRLTMELVPMGDGQRPKKVFFIDNDVPVVPLSDISGFDEYTQADLHFAGIIGSGNIQMGGSFGDIPEDVERGDIGMMMGRKTDAGDDDYGSMWFRSHLLGVVDIADVNYAVASIGSTVSG